MNRGTESTAADAIPAEHLSAFARGLEPVGRILEDPEYNVWGCSPIYGPDGKVHVFYSRWKNAFDHLGWVAACEVAHAVADRPEGPYTTLGTALKGKGGEAWDSWSIHNPTIHEVDGRYALLYMGSDGSQLGVSLEEIMAMDAEAYHPYFTKLVSTKRVGMAVADDLNGPWRRVGDAPLVQTSPRPAWDDLCTSNPTFLQHPNGEFWLYFKGWDWATLNSGGNRKYGLAVSTSLEGPYRKFEQNPVISFVPYGPHMQCEDGYVWQEDGRFYIILRDMGFYNHEYGLLLESEDGIEWGRPEIAFLDAPSYFGENLPGLDREGRFERPQLLMRDGRPEYLFCAYRGGAYRTSSGAVLKVNRS